MHCTMVAYVLSTRPFEAGTAACRCVTHNWDMGNIPAVSGLLCPLGRIEQATEEALAKIAEAARR